MQGPQHQPGTAASKQGPRRSVSKPEDESADAAVTPVSWSTAHQLRVVLAVKVLPSEDWRLVELWRRRTSGARHVAHVLRRLDAEEMGDVGGEVALELPVEG